MTLPMPMAKAQPVVAIVEPDASVREVLQRMLEARGFQVPGYASAEEFLRSERDPRPDCLVVDLHLPGLSGLQLQAELRGAGDPTPAVLITADHQGHELRERARTAGFAGVLYKPFGSDTLIDLVTIATECFGARVAKS